MALSSDLISQFVKATKDDKKTKTESTVYGTVREHNGEKYVQLDGSELLTPVTTTASYKEGERVTVLIKNHTATVTGNITSPSASSKVVDGLGKETSDAATKITELEILIANTVSSDELYAEQARIDSLVAEEVKIKEQLTAAEANIDELEADTLLVAEGLTAAEADIRKLYAEKIDAEFVEARYALIEDLEAANLDVYNLTATYGNFASLTSDKLAAIEASINNLDADKISAIDIEGKFANIDFSNIDSAAIAHLYSVSGLIENVAISNGTITGMLVGVTIKGDLIEAGTLVADKLVIQGENGLYYKLNTNGVETETEQTEYNSLNGSIIAAKSITASKIDVTDLVAFGATIGGFHITQNALYSGVKSSADNSTRGTYLDNTGQFSIGDATNYIKYYKDADGIWRLGISAESILFGIGSDRKDLSEFIKLGSYLDPDLGDSTPSIELSEGDSDFKQIVTNNKAVFLDGTTERTKIDRYGVTSTHVTAEEDMSVGGFIFKKRSNGNLGLMWKGGLG